jgi:hypothetical protein
MKKVLVKVIRDNEIQWVHFSAIPEDLYLKFFRVTGAETADLNAYLSKWCKEDFDVSLRMGTYNDIYHLKQAINERYQAEYTELYGSEEMPDIRGWVRMWLSQHMKVEIVKYE